MKPESFVCDAHSRFFPIKNWCRLDPSRVLEVGGEELISRLPQRAPFVSASGAPRRLWPGEQKRRPITSISSCGWLSCRLMSEKLFASRVNCSRKKTSRCTPGPAGTPAPVKPSLEPVRATRVHMVTSEPLEEKGEPVFEMGGARASNVISKASFGTSTSAGVHCDW